MKEIIKNAVAEVFDRNSMAEALAYVIDDLIDYDEIAKELLVRSALRDAVHDAALEYAEDLL